MQQLIANALFAASIYALVGVGFALVYRCGRFFHFAHGVIVTGGAYACFFLLDRLELPLAIAAPFGIAFATLVGCAVELVVYNPLRRVGGSSLGLLLASLGVYIVLQNLISLGFGDDTKTLRAGATATGFSVLGARVTGVQVGIVAGSVAALLAVGALLRLTKLGRMMRALANDPELARSVGVNVQSVILCAVAMGSCLGAAGGVLVALDVNMVPTMGMRILLMSVVAVVIGGEGIAGVALGALLVALVEHLGVWRLPTQWQDTIVFSVLILFLLFRPQGFLGRPVRKAAV